MWGFSVVRAQRSLSAAATEIGLCSVHRSQTTSNRWWWPLCCPLPSRGGGLESYASWINFGNAFSIIPSFDMCLFVTGLLLLPYLSYYLRTEFGGLESVAIFGLQSSKETRASLLDTEIQWLKVARHRTLAFMPAKLFWKPESSLIWGFF